MVFISGPRQCGKTTFSKMLLSENSFGEYYNWDETTFKRRWVKNPSSLIPPAPIEKISPLIVFDEIHKAKGWKSTLKGIYNTLSHPCKIIVTGSARLDVYKKGGDSLMGRYLGFRLHPLSFGELNQKVSNESPDFLYANIGVGEEELSLKKESTDIFENLWQFGGFPEPFFRGSIEFARIWRQSRLEKLVCEDLRDLSRIPELSQVEMLVALLPEKVGGLFSIQSLREDLNVAHDTIKRWLTYLKELYYFFEIKPYSKSLSRSLKKKGKIYLYDWAEVEDPGARFENMVACHLLKACQFWTDIGKGRYELCYLRNKEKREVDFLILQNRQPWLTFECKLSDSEIDPSIFSFISSLKHQKHIQIVKKQGVHRHTQQEGFEIFVLSADQVLGLLC